MHKLFFLNQPRGVTKSYKKKKNHKTCLKCLIYKNIKVGQV